MKNSIYVFALIALTAGAACGKKVPPSRPAAPATPPPAPAPEATSETTAETDEYARLRALSAEELDGLNLLKEIHFDFDRADIRESDQRLLALNAEVLRRLDFLRITVEGHCDERGTVEYNLALGERRARATYDYLISLGVAAARMRSASYGKEAPLCSESTEDCWARNRRAKLRITGNASRD